MNSYEQLKLENQLCFPLYACAKEITRKYKPFLDEIDLTYTQYIVMMVLWDKKEISVNELGKLLYLDSGTLTPLLNKLVKKEYIIKQKNISDERFINVTITIKGLDLRDEAIVIKNKIIECIDIDEEEVKNLYIILNKILKNAN